MISTKQSLAHTALIVGCGYLGRRVARILLMRGQTVYGTTQHQANTQALAQIGVRPLITSVTQVLTLAALRPAVEAESLDVYYLVPPGRRQHQPSPRQVVIEGMAHVLDTLAPGRVRRAVLASSTAVYGQRQGESVDASTPPQPRDERGHLQLEGERQWLASGPAAHVVRLTGLYGPGRVIGLAAIRQGAPIVGDPQALLNLIHVHDAAELMVAVMGSPMAARTELGCDGAPIPRIRYYRYLARKLGASEPRVLDDAQAAEQFALDPRRLHHVASKACDHGPTMLRTGWRPLYPSYRQGLDAIIPQRT